MAHILIVDDSALIRKQLEHTLAGAGHRVTPCAYALEALDFAEKSDDIDLVITDVNMPDMNGLELVITLRAQVHLKTTPIFVLTTESTEHIRAEGAASGATAWLVKPFNPKALLAGIDSVLNPSSGATENNQ